MKTEVKLHASLFSGHSLMKSSRNALLALAFVLASTCAPAGAIAFSGEPASFHDSSTAINAWSPQLEWDARGSFRSRSQYESSWARDETETAGASDDRLAAKALTAPTAPPPQAEKIALALIAFAACTLWYGLGRNKEVPVPVAAGADPAYDSFGSSRQGIPFLPEFVYDETREFEHAQIIANERL